MPRNMSAWLDLTINLIIMLVLIGVLSYYNTYVAVISFVIWISLVSFARERCLERSKRFERYCRSVVGSIGDMVKYATEELPQGIIMVNKEGRIQWNNQRISDFVGHAIEQDTDIKEIFPSIIIEPIWNTSGQYTFTDGDKYFSVRHEPVKMAVHAEEIMVLYIQDVSGFEHLRNEYFNSRPVICYIQIDNYDEIMQGMNEAERTKLLLQVNQELDDWMKALGGFMRRVGDDLFIVMLERHALDHAMTERFDVLDRVRQIVNKNRLPVTLSMGVSVADTQTMDELGSQAQAGLDLALGRGGDQVAVQIGGKVKFYGGRAKAVEKHTRVKARVVAHSLKDLMESADEIFIMGHHNEDFDCFGAALGVASMARKLGKQIYIVLSDMNEGIDKFSTFLSDKEEYENLFIRREDLPSITALNPLLIVVDTHIPHLTAAPELLDRIPRTIVIDHHRRSENFVKNPLLVYIEPASSSTCELITELIMYFDDSADLSSIDATALYSGIVVDTKNFAVQTGVRTFDAAAYLRRSGADPVMVRHLFRTDYDTTMVLAQAKVNSEYIEGGLIVSCIPEMRTNSQIIAAQAADSFLKIEGVRMSFVVFRLKPDTVGISARSTGELNVQVIMEDFGGGGHQNVAGAQIKGANIEDIKRQVIEKATAYIKEYDKDESDTD